MSVSSILKRKGNDVATAAPTAPVRDICAMLAERRIGAIVLTGADTRIVGIVSERDIVRGLALRGAAILDEPVSTVMTRSVVTCAVDDLISDVMRQMSDGKFRHVPVVDQAGRLAGIVSIGDVVKSRLSDLEAETSAMRDYIVMA